MNKYIHTACVIVLTIGGVMVERQAITFLQQWGQVTLNIQAPLNNLNTAIHTFNDASDKWKGSIENTDKATAKVVTLVDDFDDQVNNHLLPKLTDAVQDFQEESHTTLAGLNIAVMSANSFIGAGTDTMQALTRRVDDPRIDDTFNNIDVMSLHLDQMTGEGASILGHGDHIIGYYDARLTSPKGFLKTLGQGLLQLVVPGADTYIACCKPTTATLKLTQPSNLLAPSKAK